MKVRIFDNPLTPDARQALLRDADRGLRVAIDVQLALVAAGGEYHHDCEIALLAAGSDQGDIWGATWHPSTGTIDYVSVINLRPRLGMNTMEIQDESLRARIGRIVRLFLEAE